MRRITSLCALPLSRETRSEKEALLLVERNTSVMGWGTVWSQGDSAAYPGCFWACDFSQVTAHLLPFHFHKTRVREYWPLGVTLRIKWHNICEVVSTMPLHNKHSLNVSCYYYYHLLWKDVVCTSTPFFAMRDSTLRKTHTKHLAKVSEETSQHRAQRIKVSTKLSAAWKRAPWQGTCTYYKGWQYCQDCALDEDLFHILRGTWPSRQYLPCLAELFPFCPCSEVAYSCKLSDWQGQKEGADVGHLGRGGTHARDDGGHGQYRVIPAIWEQWQAQWCCYRELE